MMTEIRYRIRFFSDWHCGSGLSAGADMDALVVRDRKGLPYVPGKTMKGLVREAVADLLFLTYGDQVRADLAGLFDETFGFAGEDNRAGQGSAFFTDAVIPEKEAALVLKTDAVRFLFRKQAFTSLSEEGIAKEHSLREIEKVVPCTLEGSVLNVEEEFVDHVKAGMRMIRRLGLDRNRGLGRCSIEFINIG